MSMSLLFSSLFTGGSVSMPILLFYHETASIIANFFSPSTHPKKRKSGEHPTPRQRAAPSALPHKEKKWGTPHTPAKGCALCTPALRSSLQQLWEAYCSLCLNRADVL